MPLIGRFFHLVSLFTLPFHRSSTAIASASFTQLERSSKINFLQGSLFCEPDISLARGRDPRRVRGWEGGPRAALGPKVQLRTVRSRRSHLAHHAERCITHASRYTS